jgi:hypothetical protein
MSTDKNETNFLDRLDRPIKPSPEITEPLLWFQNLYLVKKLGEGLSKPNLIRNFELRRGLNVLWAQPEDPETSEGLYGDGIAGHSTGKTLFCRILRYLLGEPNFGTSELEGHVADTFQDLWAVATIRLNRKTWVVGRPLAGTGTEFALEEGVIATVFTEVPPPQGYKDFTNALEKDCGSPLSTMFPVDAWRNLIPWIARDQEARFSKITSWRDSSSGADSPQGSSNTKHLIFRAVLDLLGEGEFDIRQKISDLEEQIKTWNSSLPLKQTIASRDRRKVEEGLRKVKNLQVSLADLTAAKEYVESQRTIREEALLHFRNQAESDEVLAARKELQKVISTQASVAARIKSIDLEIPGLEKEAADSLLLKERVKKSGYPDPARIEKDFCPHSYLAAIRNKCLEGSSEEIKASMAEIEELEKQGQAMVDRVQAKKDEKARLESLTDQIAADLVDKNAALSRALAAFPTPAIAIEKEIAHIETLESLLDDAIESAADEAVVSAKISEAQKTIAESRDKLAFLKADVDRKLKSFSAIFADIVRAVLGASVSAWAEMEDKFIRLHVKRTRELGGAAMESVKTIAFDLAAMIHGMEGHGRHPGFLIHDGPREADMARVIYERFFFYALRMEAAYEPDQANFQYILTTTTNPPADMREGSKWLLGEKLSGKTKAGRLLMEDF